MVHLKKYGRLIAFAYFVVLLAWISDSFMDFITQGLMMIGAFAVGSFIGEVIQTKYQAWIYNRRFETVITREPISDGQFSGTLTTISVKERESKASRRAWMRQAKQEAADLIKDVEGFGI